ncbi:OX-2 membrane glycoprotein [Crotalus adamanteus]|uniref:OX-2 membrane glycoprotein n=1 Tax=Crotalus adamanteus TaxID=8729 RepID=A0AAW1BJQ5_CROAD
MRMKGIYTTWTLQDLALCVIAVVFCSTQGSVMTSNQDVELGGNVTLRCTLLQHSNIYQVTWAKKKNGNDENIATYKKDTGPVMGQPCLSVYDNLKTSTDHNISDNHLRANCLATGFPRPNISWFPPEGEKKEKDITNPNGTLSVISNIFVSMSKVKQGLTCHVTHRGKTISIEVLGKEIDRTKKSFPVIPVVLALILVILVIVVGICGWRRQRKKHRGF